MTARHLDVLLAGAGGPVGRAVERHLRGTGRSVLATSRRGRAALDVFDDGAVSDVLSTARPAAVGYLVNTPADGVSERERAVGSLRQFVRNAARHGVDHVVFASSGAVYGDRGSAPLAEDHPLEGATPYAALKKDSEAALRAECAREGLSCVILRIFNVFGEGCDSSLINRLVGGPAPSLLDTPDFVRDYVHVDDVADAFARAFARRVNGTMNVGTGRPVDNVQLAAIAPAERYLLAQPPAGFRSYSVSDPTDAAASLGWRHRVDVLDHLRDRS